MSAGNTPSDDRRGRVGRLLNAIAPPPRWKIPVIIVLGIMTGLGILILRISNAPSYLSDDPQACINCHVMYPEYTTWRRSSHGRGITCNDCHVPHDNPVRSYAFKAQDGTRHAYMFTFHLEPQVIQIHEAGRGVVQENCIRCHEHLVGGTTAVDVTASNVQHGAGKLCWDCHRETPHGRIHSLSSAPYARVPMLSPVVPAWIDSILMRN